jgi:hypothetical protein
MCLTIGKIAWGVAEPFPGLLGGGLFDLSNEENDWSLFLHESASPCRKRPSLAVRTSRGMLESRDRKTADGDTYSRNLRLSTKCHRKTDDADMLTGDAACDSLAVRPLAKGAEFGCAATSSAETIP